MTPFLMAVVMLAQNHAEANAGLAITAIALMVQAVDIGFIKGFGADKRGRCEEDAAGQCNGSNR